MTRSAKLGIASTLLLAISLVPPYWNWREPVSFASVGVSCILSVLAAREGSRWWLVIPGLMIAGFALGLYFAAHSF